MVCSGTYVCVGVCTQLGERWCQNTVKPQSLIPYLHIHLLTLMSPKTSTCSSFAVAWDMGRNGPMYTFPTEVERGRSAFLSRSYGDDQRLGT